MIDLEHLWPDPDRRDDALYRVAAAVGHSPPERTQVHPAELRALQAVSVGLDERGAAHVLGLARMTVTTQLRDARRALRAKNTTHACCEALRQGLIR
jgi:DNA-binding CsgD family transcriptional regulator